MNKFAFSLSILALGYVAQAGLVSSYEFDDTLATTLNPLGTAGALEFREGGSSNAPAGSPVGYSTEMVGGSNKRVAAFSDATAQYFKAPHGLAANGGGAYVNLYSILMDVKVTSRGDWVSLFNTNAFNSNDGDLFIRDADSGVGISGVYAGTFPRDEWARVVITVDSTDLVSEMKTYVNGVLFNTNVMDGLDGRWSLYAYNDGSANTVDIFGDDDGDNGSGMIDQLAFFDSALSAEDVRLLGPVGTSVGAPVPEPATMVALGLGAAAMLRRRRK